MKYRALGATGIEVSEIGFGAWAIGGPTTLGDTVLGWGPGDDRAALSALASCLDHGINFIDTADIYGDGHSEELIGQAFRGRRDKVILATKAGNTEDESGTWVKDFSRRHVLDSLEGSLRRLRTDTIDVFQLHTPEAGSVISEELFAVLEEARAAGKIRFYGVSIGNLEHGEIVTASSWGDTIQLVYNFLCRGAEDRVLPAARTAEMGVIARVPLASGFLTGKYSDTSEFPEDDWRAHRYPPELRAPLIELVERLRPLARPGRTLAQSALRFCLRQEAISTVIVGARNAAQLAENAAASEAPDFTEEELRWVDEIAQLERCSAS